MVALLCGEVGEDLADRLGAVFVVGPLPEGLAGGVFGRRGGAEHGLRVHLALGLGVAKLRGAEPRERGLVVVADGGEELVGSMPADAEGNRL